MTDNQHRINPSAIRTLKSAILLSLVLVYLVVGRSSLPGITQDPVELYPSDNERFGFGVISNINDYDVGLLHAGWYVNWGASSQAPHPAGLEYVQIIRLSDDGYSPDQATLTQIAQDNPGLLWLIGNEPDTCYGQDCVLPDRYAELYHELYYLLKELDHTCQVAIGGVVQATPLRLQYLDIIWDTYLNLYGERMPVDVWNVHNFILREKRDPPDNWGCGIPPGIHVSEGEVREIGDHDRMYLFEQQINSFREWMRDKGERDKPLIVSEYGILFPQEHGYDYTRVQDFMLNSFDFFLTATDTDIGYPTDGNRLVQRWAWYSLEDDSFDCSDWNPPCTTWSNLFDPGTKEIESLGYDFRIYIEDNGLITPYYDLQPVTLTLQSEYTPVYGQPVSLTLSSRVVNWGNSSTGPFVVSFWDNDDLLGESHVGGVGPRYEGEILVDTSWRDPLTGTHTFRVLADSDYRVDEWREDNNAAAVDLGIDLALSELHAPMTLTQPGETIDITVTAKASNLGDVILRDLVVQLRDGGSPEPVATVIIAEIGPGVWQDISLTWPDRSAGLHLVIVVADPENLIIESNEENNWIQGTAFVASHWVALPLAYR